jgi:hypothetical protein
MLKKIVIEEGDALRNLSKLPYQSDIYYMKLNQIQPLIIYRMELEKIVQEQRFARQSEDYPGFSNVKKKNLFSLIFAFHFSISITVDT